MNTNNVEHSRKRLLKMVEEEHFDIYQEFWLTIDESHHITRPEPARRNLLNKAAHDFEDFLQVVRTPV